jgi:hypothetical protein
MKFEFSRRIFEKHWNIKLYENPSGGSLVVPYWPTDVASSRYSQFIEQAYKQVT